MSITLSNPAVVRDAFEKALATHSQERGHFFLARFLGFELTYSDESCTVVFAVREDLCNPRGLLHGGVVATALDVAMGHLTQHVAACGAATAGLTVQYFRAVRTGTVRATARIARKGSRLWFLEADLVGADGERLASASSTVALAQGDETTPSRTHSQ